MKTTLSCIILFVQDVDKLKYFYMNNFNLDLVEEIKSEWVLLKAGHCEIGLHKIGAQYMQTIEIASQSRNNTKIVLEIDQDIFTIHKELKAKNVALNEIKSWENYPYWICDGEDPEQNVFQLRMKK